MIQIRDETMEDMIRKMPKIELHAHLNGCIPRHVLEALLIEKHHSNREFCEAITKQLNSEKCSYQDFFKMLTSIHEMTTKHSIIQKITYEVIKAFDNDNVIYLELRSVPKHNQNNYITKQYFSIIKFLI